MAFWIFMLIMDILIPTVMILFGRSFIQSDPKQINCLFGYRSDRSMKNRDTWIFAHQYCGRLWLRWGLIMLPLSVLLLISVIGESVERIGTFGMILCFLQLVPLVGSIIPTERALKRTFDEYGHRKTKAD